MAVEMISTSEPWASRHETPEEFRQWLEQSVGQIFIAESDEQPAGLVAFIPGPVLANGGCIQLLVVRGDSRREGIGRQLMGFAERKVARQGANIYASVPGTSTAAQQFFERLGYEKVGEVPDLAKPGEAEWLLRKKLSSSGDRRPPRRG